MKRYTIYILFLSVLFLSCSNSSTEPEANLTSSISPSEQTILIGSQASYSVEIDNITGLFAFSCEIVFDSTKVSLPENPVAIGSFWSGDYISTSISDNDRLNIAIGLEQSPEIDGLSGNGVLFNFTIEGIQTGSSSLSFENITLINDEGEPVEGFENITLSDGLIIIQ